MHPLPESLMHLTTSLQTLPGIGVRTAMRLAMHLAHSVNHSKARSLAASLTTACNQLVLCEQCRHYADDRLCSLCMQSNRDDSLLCVVESPADIVAIEKSGGYKGRYFVLHGKLSPIDGVGPEQLGFVQLAKRVRSPYCVRELVLALGSTVEADVTCHYLQRFLRNEVMQITRLAQGIPSGGNLELLDNVTLHKALAGRTALSEDRIQDS